jgi:hypothetical protein
VSRYVRTGHDRRQLTPGAFQEPAQDKRSTVRREPCILAAPSRRQRGPMKIVKHVPKVVSLPLVLCATACAGEPRVLAPRTPPARQMPAVALPESPLSPDQARVVLDTTDGPMRLTVQSDPSFVPPGADRAPSRVGELCTTPCVADLPVGRYRLFLAPTGGASTGDADDITLSHGLTIYRRAPGKYETPSLTNAIPPAVLLAASLVLTVLAPLAAASASDNGGRTGALVLTGLGVAGLIGGGLWLYDARRATQQEGATAVWQQATR